MRDNRTRRSHVNAHGQVRFLDEPFLVGDTQLKEPRDPDGPPEETFNCRCTREVYPLSQLPSHLVGRIAHRLTNEQRRFLEPGFGINTEGQILQGFEEEDGGEPTRVAQSTGSGSIATQIPIPPSKPTPPSRPWITGVPLKSRAKRILGEILLTAGLTAARVTDTTRTPKEQAEAMYDLIIAKGLSRALGTYLPPGKEVIQVYVRNKNKPRKEVIKLMTQKINQLGPTTVSKHLDPTVFAFDVAPSSIQDHSAFKKAVLAHPEVTKFLFPPGDPRAFHIEILP